MDFVKQLAVSTGISNTGTERTENKFWGVGSWKSLVFIVHKWLNVAKLFSQIWDFTHFNTEKSLFSPKKNLYSSLGELIPISFFVNQSEIYYLTIAHMSGQLVVDSKAQTQGVLLCWVLKQ